MPHKSKSPRPSQSLEFKAKEFHHHPKNQFWYVGIGLLVVGFFVLAINQHQYLLSVVVAAVGIAIFRTANLQPSVRQIRLTAKGVYWGEHFYGYHQLRAFWIAAPHDQVTLYLERLNLAPQISFIIPASALEKTADFLGDHLPYHDHRSEPLSERFSRLLRL